MRRTRCGLGIGLLLILPALFIYFASTYLWTIPAPSDALEYVAPAIWKTANFDNFYFYNKFDSTAIYHWPYLDRIVVLILLYITTLLPIESVMVAPTAILCIDTVILLLAMGWAYRLRGLFSSIMVGVLLGTSYVFLRYSTYMYADQTLTLFLLMAVIAYDWDEQSATRLRRIAVTGALSAAAFFSKGLGIAATVFFVSHFVLLRRRELDKIASWRAILHEVMYFGLGGLAGTALVLGTFILIYGGDSIVAIFRGFFIESRSRMLRGAAFGNMVTYLKPIFDLKLLPALAALFILARAWRKPEAATPFGMAGAFLLSLSMIYAFSSRGGNAILNYIHAPVVFASIGTGIYLSTSTRQVARKWGCHDHDWDNILASVSVLLALAGGVIVAASIPEDTRIDYFFESGVHSSIARNLAPFFTLAPAVLLVLLTMYEATNWRLLAISFGLVAAFWGAAYPGVQAYREGVFAAAEGRAYYDAASMLERVPATVFSVFYVNRWGRDDRLKSLDWWRVLWTFHVFLGERFGRGVGAAAKVRHQELIAKSITWVHDAKQLAAVKPGTILLTDSVPDVVAACRSNCVFDTLLATTLGDRKFTVLQFKDSSGQQ